MNSTLQKFLSGLEDLKTLAIIGIEKNTGKTETLNFVVSMTKTRRTIGLTSIGTDGEEKDLVFGTAKPSVYVDEGMFYTTTELFYRRRTVSSEIHYVSERTTPTGRLIVAKALHPGRVVISGPTDNTWMREIIDYMHKYVDFVLIDGALSRFTQASPTIADGVILATGAAYSLVVSEIVRHTKYVYTLCTLPEVPATEKVYLLNKSTVSVYNSEDGWIETNLETGLQILKDENVLKLIEKSERIYIPTSLTDSLINLVKDKEIIVRDFTKVFVSQEKYLKYRPKIRVLQGTKVVGITVNPFSPVGYVLDSKRIIEELNKVLPNVPIVDVRGDLDIDDISSKEGEI
ncbi:hypothetical protein [Fervidobacterium thailandense]|uniref:Uncharacterized protein n=1 Tax=Fervidobacterium thailandense TaxID=1008305 RepID=A0A1E3G522_9BACT|nr:hypothetical protein [Fervidobacterium thailandense]ODN30748.1 hypothetical protein A4H02_04255 [Fervidobacterium thailandense]